MATDPYGRRIDYLRISLTDRCNLRCVYCMPEAGVEWREHEEILTFEEIERFARIAFEEGISKVRLTGGEPLVRRGLVDHVRRMVDIVGSAHLALTTNGTLLAGAAGDLAAAGLSRVNVSLDTLDPMAYERVTRGGKLGDALAGIDAALEAGMQPVKVNVVMMEGLEQDLAAFAALTMERPLHVRFIERMPVGALPIDGRDVWSPEGTITSDEVLARLASEGRAAGFGEIELVGPDAAPGGWGPARYYRFAGAAGTIGVISPLTHHFCDKCNRLRLTADGRLRPCLFDDEEILVREVLRHGEDQEVRRLVLQALSAKPEGHGRRAGTARRMSQIGG